MQQKSLFSRVVPPAVALLMLVFVVRFLSAPVETTKWIGAPFLIVPQLLGLTPVVSSSAVQTITLREASPVLEVTQPGQYALYAADETMQLRANAMSDMNTAWVRMRPAGADASATITGIVVTRGAAIYDPIAIAGRPTMSFLIEKPGRYELIYGRQGGVLYFAEDPVTGYEGVIRSAILVQLLLIGGLMLLISLPRIRQQRADARIAAEELKRKRAEAAEFVRRNAGEGSK
ncbi:MAG: hypothetical protein NTZ50_00480 [Chloroflexi bacterium]|nr:hypothetical protein [Chloroflexota bacterium]